jgi:hypothetical protein
LYTVLSLFLSLCTRYLDDKDVSAAVTLGSLVVTDLRKRERREEEREKRRKRKVMQKATNNRGNRPVGPAG